MKRKILIFSVLAAVSILHTGCFLFSTSSSQPSEPTVDYAPQQLRNGAYIAFTGSQGSEIKIVFQTNNVSDIPSCSASGGRINAAYYHYDGFNLATLTYNYSPNGGVSSQYKAELKFTRDSGGTITFLDTKETASFTYRP